MLTSWRRTTIGLGVAIAAVLASTTSSVAKPKQIVPDDLPMGKAPHYTYLTEDPEQLVTRDGTKIAPTDGATTFGVPYAVRQGWLMQVEIDRKNTVVLIRHDGTQSVVTTLTYGGNPVVSSDGRRFAITTDLARVDVYRIKDGKRLARLNSKGWLYVRAMTPTRVILAHEPRRYHPKTYRLESWAYASKHKPVHTIFHAPYRYYYEVRDLPVDLSAGQFVQFKRGYDLVRPLAGRGPRWRTKPGEKVLSWSPDDRYILTGYVSSEELGTVRVRNHRTGRVVARFYGFLQTVRGPSNLGPTWETSNALLLTAWANVTDTDDTGTVRTGHGTLRCYVSKQKCERVLPGDAEPRWAIRKSS